MISRLSTLTISRTSSRVTGDLRRHDTHLLLQTHMDTYVRIHTNTRTHTHTHTHMYRQYDACVSISLQVLATWTLSLVTPCWRHHMEWFSALLAICAGNSPVTGEFPAQRPVTRSFDVFFDLRWINGWVNNGEAGDLRRHRAHYGVIVMQIS